MSKYTDPNKVSKSNRKKYLKFLGQYYPEILKKINKNQKTNFKKVQLALIKINHLAKDFEKNSPDMSDYTDKDGWEDRDAFFKALDDFKLEQDKKFYSLKNKVIDLALKAGHLRFIGKHQHIGGQSDSVGSKFAIQRRGFIIGEFHTNYKNPVSKNQLGFLQKKYTDKAFYTSNMGEKEAREVLEEYIDAQKKKSGKKFLKNKAIFKRKYSLTN